MTFFLRAALACAAFLALSVSLSGSPAYAHDALKRSSPAKDAEVSAASVEEIELEYTASVKFPFVVLRDAAGKEVPLSKPRLAGPKVFAEVGRPLAAGAYVIAWRVVSSDGHPIEGEIPFRVKGSASPSVSSTPAGEGATEGGPSAAASPSSAGGGASSGTSSGVPGWIWGGLAALVALGAFVLIRAARRGPDGEEAHAD
ncbi:copper resistance CopC family protein [Nonomuraea sp. SYSU D8015]|uniref:copper resistance CopC family protein n=1 Tax=Nonomuraea sp. SYSU D8015 TaxID=2593644 RepID=UPI001660D67E|nr:copper resistance CopC family protein [Nonomuraea sp. SYSU D8015]